MAWNDNPFMKNLPHIIAVCVLIFIMLFILVRFGYVRCCDIPGFCDIYYGIVGQPRVAIVYGTDGMGNPEALYELMVQRTGKMPDMIPLEDVTAGGVLNGYQMIIVERAATMDTSTLYVFKDFVSSGKKLVWIGDAGTKLTSKDYVCYEAKLNYLPSTPQPKSDVCNQMSSNDSYTKCMNGLCGELSGSEKALCEQAQQGEYCAQNFVEYVIRTPDTTFPGICGHSFADIVAAFAEANRTIYNSQTTGGKQLCKSEPDNYKITGTGSERILKCIKRITDAGQTITTQSVNTYCSFDIVEFPYAENAWDRGPSTSYSGAKVNAINFGATVLGLDFVANRETNLFLQPVEGQQRHPLVKGYSVGTQWFNAANFTIVDATNYRLRSCSVMNIRMENEYYPAILVSNPSGPNLACNGNLVYYAFPPEAGAPENRGLNLIDNLFEFALCS